MLSGRLTRARLDQHVVRAGPVAACRLVATDRRLWHLTACECAVPLCARNVQGVSAYAYMRMRSFVACLVTAIAAARSAGC